MMRLFNSKATRRMVIVLAAAVAVLAASAWFVLFRSQGTRVELGNVSPGNVGVQSDNRPVLRVAVAAMISPEATSSSYNDLLVLLGDKVGRRVVFLQRRTYAEVSALLEKKEVDVAFECAGPYVSDHDRFGIEILAVPVSHGENVYYSYIIAPKDSKVTSLDGLRGGRFAFSDPDSNTGCLVPKYMLAKRGETPASFFGETFFTNSHDNSIKAVAEGLADGASVDSLIWESLDSDGSPLTAGTRIIDKSPPYGIPPIVVHPELDPVLKARLKESLLSLHEDPKAKQLMDRLRIDRFEPGDDRMYDSVREMNRWVSKKGDK